MTSIGLTLGKYAPFHKGHEYVIETMLAEMDEAIVIIYETDATEIPLPIRANWIRRRFPDVTVIEAWDGPHGLAYDREYEKAEEEFIKGLLDGVEITAFYSSEYYGAHVSRSLQCHDRRVDESRLVVPISARQIRAHPYENRHYMSAHVYRDLITKIVFLGSVSTGKSTIAEAMAREFNTNHVREYGRDYWEQHQVDRRLPLTAFDEIAIGHIAIEEEAFPDSNRYCFIDTNAITTYMFALDYHGRASDSLTRLAQENSSRYDLFFLCEDDIPYDDTWDRSGSQKRAVFQRQIIADLNTRKIPYIVLSGDLPTRINRVTSILDSYQQFSNWYGNRR
jgi:NadR type nicotinamide-nucleotide adenylyltransferase